MVSFGLQLCIVFTTAVKNAKQILQFETLRLYGPVFYIPRYTADSFQHLNIQGKEYPIPPHTHVHLNTAALHTLPSYWGTNSLAWRPDRWLDEKEELLQPLPGMYNPWTAGDRKSVV